MPPPPARAGSAWRPRTRSTPFGRARAVRGRPCSGRSTCGSARSTTRCAVARRARYRVSRTRSAVRGLPVSEWREARWSARPDWWRASASRRHGVPAGVSSSELPPDAAESSQALCSGTEGARELTWRMWVRGCKDSKCGAVREHGRAPAQLRCRIAGNWSVRSGWYGAGVDRGGGALFRGLGNIQSRLACHRRTRSHEEATRSSRVASPCVEGFYAFGAGGRGSWVTVLCTGGTPQPARLDRPGTESPVVAY